MRQQAWLLFWSFLLGLEIKLEVRFLLLLLASEVLLSFLSSEEFLNVNGCEIFSWLIIIFKFFTSLFRSQALYFWPLLCWELINEIF